MASISRRAALSATLGASAALTIKGFDTRPYTEVAAVVPAVSIPQSDLDKAIVVATPGRFSGIDPTGSADSAVGLQAAMNATPDGGTLIVPTGTYRVGTALYPKLSRSMRIRAFGAKFLQASGSPIFSVTGDYGTVYSVSSLSVSTAAGYGPQAKLTLTASPPWSQGDVVKVISDDVISGARPGPGDGTESRCGEFAVVNVVNGRTILLNGLLRDSYGTNIRIVRLSRQTFVLEGGDFEATAERLAAKNNAVLFFSKLFAPQVIGSRVTRAGGTALQFSSCFAYVARDVHVDFGVDDASQGRLGYGILDNSCAYGLVDGGVFKHVRHAYTDDTDRVAANSDPGSYGRTYGTTLSNVSALMTTNSSFDTHHCSNNVTFLGCIATGGRSQGDGQFGFQLRGLNHRVISCAAVGTDGGIQVHTEKGGGQSRGHYVADFRVRDTAGPAVRVAIRQAGHPQAGQRDAGTIEIRGLMADQTGSLLVASNATISLGSATFRAPAGVAGTNAQGIYADNCALDVSDTILDFTTNTAGTPRVYSSGQTAGTQPGQQDSYLRDVEVRANADVVSRTWAVINGPGHMVRAQGLRFTYPFRMMAGEDFLEGSQVDWRCDHVPGVTAGLIDSSSFGFGNSDLSNVLQRLNRSSDPNIYLRGSSTINIVMPAFPAGIRLGQRVTIHYQGNQTLTLKHGSATRLKLVGSSDRAMTSDTMCHLVWDGKDWTELR